MVECHLDINVLEWQDVVFDLEYVVILVHPEGQSSPLLVSRSAIIIQPPLWPPHLISIHKMLMFLCISMNCLYYSEFDIKLQHLFTDKHLLLHKSTIVWCAFKITL